MSQTITLPITSGLLWAIYNEKLQPPEGSVWTDAVLFVESTSLPEHTSAVFKRTNYIQVADPERGVPSYLRETPEPVRDFDAIFDFELFNAPTGVTSIAIVPMRRISCVQLIYVPAA